MQQCQRAEFHFSRAHRILRSCRRLQRHCSRISAKENEIVKNDVGVRLRAAGFDCRLRSHNGLGQIVNDNLDTVESGWHLVGILWSAIVGSINRVDSWRNASHNRRRHVEIGKCSANRLLHALRMPISGVPDRIIHWNLALASAARQIQFEMAVVRVLEQLANAELMESPLDEAIRALESGRR